MQRMLEKLLEQNQAKIANAIWKKINAAWTVFFVLLGGLNLFVAYHFSTNAWVNFKLYGTLGLVFLFSFLQSIYLARKITTQK